MATTAESITDGYLTSLATACLYVLTNRANLYFPQSSRSHPSPTVVVDLTPKPPYRGGDRAYFPLIVGWAVWHEAVTPVLLNPDVQFLTRDNVGLRQRQNTDLLALGEFNTLIAKLKDYLRSSLIEHEYMPPDPPSENAVQGPLHEEPAGAPIVLPPVPSPVFYHPDGTPRLTYNIVDAG